MKTPNFNCSQSALYQVANNVVQSMSNNLSAFSDFKTKYNAAYLDTLRDEIKTVETMPDFRGRSAQSEVDFIHLCDQLQKCTALWQTLKRYIESTYPEAEQSPRLEEAGASYYTKSYTRHWESARALMLSGQNFITNHATELSDNQNMPTTFAAVFEAESNKFNELLTNYQQASEKIKLDTNKKITANNNLYDRVSEICLDGQIIFKQDEAMKAQFVFSSVLSIVSGHGTTGFKGTITDSITQKPIAGVTVASTGFDKTAITDADGFYEILQVAAGNYTITFTAADFSTHTISDYNVNSGVTHNLNVQMVHI